MKKHLSIVILVCVCTLLFAACTQQPASPGIASPGGEVSPPPASDAPDAQTPSQTPDGPAPTSDEAPLEYGEMVLSDASVNDIVAAYGEYETYEIAYYPADGNTYLRLLYPQLIIEFRSHYGEELSFLPKDGDGGFDFGERTAPLTEDDKATQLKVLSMAWNDPSIKGPRGTQIGDDESSVLAKFMRTQGENPDVLYTMEEAFPGFTPLELAPTESSIQPFDSQEDSWHIAQGASSVIEYIAVDPEIASQYIEYQYTRFYIADGKVAAIEQGLFEQV